MLVKKDVTVEQLADVLVFAHDDDENILRDCLDNYPLGKDRRPLKIVRVVGAKPKDNGLVSLTLEVLTEGPEGWEKVPVNAWRAVETMIGIVPHQETSS